MTVDRIALLINGDDATVGGAWGGYIYLLFISQLAAGITRYY